MRRCLVFAVFVGLITAVAAPVFAAATQCTSRMTGAIDGDVVVPTDESCELRNVTVSGDVIVQQGAFLTVTATGTTLQFAVA